MKKIFSLVLVFVIFLSACSDDTQQSSEDITLDFWTISLQPTFNDDINAMIDQFESEHEGVTVNWTDLPYDSITNNLLTSIASGDAPDVVNLNTQTALEMAQKDALVDYNEYLSEDEQAEYFEGLYGSTMIDDSAYGLPWYTGGYVMYVNSDVVEEAGLDINELPTTHSDLLDWYGEIKDATGVSGACSKADVLMMEEPYMNDDNTQAAFNTDENKEILEGYKEEFDNQVLLKCNSSDEEVQNFVNGTTATIHGNTTVINKIETTNPELLDSVVVAQEPTGINGATYASTMDLVVPADSENIDMSVEFAQFITNSDNQTAFSKAANTLPSTVNSLEDPYFTETDGSIESEAKLISTENLDVTTDFVIDNGVRQAINIELENYIFNDKPLDEALNDAETEANRLLSEQ